MSSQDRYSFLVPRSQSRGYLAAVLLMGGLLAYDQWYFKHTASRVDPTVLLVALIFAASGCGLLFVRFRAK